VELSGLDALHRRLVDWLLDEAYPLWCRSGIEESSGAFAETLDLCGVSLGGPRRARVPPRQLFAFAHATAFGWKGDVSRIVRRGLESFTLHFQRSDGLIRALVDEAGSPLDERALLYDQAFALLGYAAAAQALDALKEMEHRAVALRDQIERRLGAGDGQFLSAEGVSDLRESNPHMHLLEACLTWSEIGHDSGWVTWVKSLAEVAVTRFVRTDSGALGESYRASGDKTPGDAGRVLEPGHQFEWAWLLLRCEHHHRAALRPAALKLIEIGNVFGVKHGVAINALWDDNRVKDGQARLWPQTERLKAALLAGSVTGDSHYWTMAYEAASSLIPYLKTPMRGLWFDQRLTHGNMAHSPVPASTFYHLVGAIQTLHLLSAKAVIATR
jgi:mannose/cellobiose epimerase-like protein (N-acyl-D-glucosamine 2-epimerase family)